MSSSKSRNNLYLLKMLLSITIFICSHPTFAGSITGKVTHSINVPSSGTVYNPITVSWSPLSTYSDINFSFVKVGYRNNGGSYNFVDYNGSSASFNLSQTGSWCFIVRGWNQDLSHFGNFNSEKCVTITDSVSGLVTHSISVQSSSYINTPFTVSWSPLADFSGQAVSFVKVGYNKNGGSYNFQDLNSSSKNYNFSEAGNYCFLVRAWINGGFGNFNTPKCITVQNPPVPAIPQIAFLPNYVTQGTNYNVSWSNTGAANYNLTKTYGSDTTTKGFDTTNTTDNNPDYGRVYYKVQACNSSNDCSAWSPVKSTYVYASPGFVKNLTVDKSEVEINESTIIRWANAGGIVTGFSYEVSLNEELLYTGTNTQFPHLQMTPGVYEYKIGACNSNLPCTVSSIWITVKEPPIVDPIQGTANFIYEEGMTSLIDPYYNENETLAWDISDINNATSYEIVVDKAGTITKYSTVQTEQYATFKFGNNITSYNTKDTVKVYLNGCNSNGCNMVSDKTEIILVNWRTNTYGETPKHILFTTAEVSVTDDYVYNKLFNKIPDPRSLDFPKHIYTNDPEEFFDAYLYPYDIPMTGSYSKERNFILNTNEALFDGVIFWNNMFKRSLYTLNENSLKVFFTEGPSERLKTNSTNNNVRHYLDNIFGVKFFGKFGKDDIADRIYVFENEDSFLEGLNKSAAKSTIESQIGFYMMLPVPFTKCTEEVDGNGVITCSEGPVPYDEDLIIKRLKLYIDEIMEQYALFQATYPASYVKLVGFKLGAESAGGSNLYLKAIQEIKAYLGEFSDTGEEKLKLVASGYSNLWTYEEFDQHKYAINPLARYSNFYNEGIIEQLDNLWIQPNATIMRFTSRSTNGQTPDLDKTAVDREVLNWFNQGLFSKEEYDVSKYSIMFEYTRHFGTSPTIKTSGESSNFPPHVSHKSHTDISYDARFDGDAYAPGNNGDISYYADYIATEFPDSYKNGDRPIIYDDNGAVLYCYVQYAIGNNNKCDGTVVIKNGPGWEDDEYPVYDIVESISDVRSIYSFIKKLRNSDTAQYQGDNQLFSTRPLVSIKPDVTDLKNSQEINVVNKNTLSIKSLVRARLKDTIVHNDPKVDKCSAEPVIEVTFDNNEIHTIKLSQTQLTKACKTFAQMIADNTGNRAHWRDADQWLKLSSDIPVPKGASNATITLKVVSINSEDNVKEFVYYRPDYQIN